MSDEKTIVQRGMVIELIVKGNKLTISTKMHPPRAAVLHDIIDCWNLDIDDTNLPRTMSDQLYEIILSGMYTAWKNSGLAHSLLVGHRNADKVKRAKILLNLSPSRLSVMRAISSLMVG
jgi:hypothetical protein